MGLDAFEDLGYSQLKDLRLEIEADRGPDFAICFWVYLPISTRFPSTILHQVDQESRGNARFIVLNEEKKMMLLPLHFLHKESANPGHSASANGFPCVCSGEQFPLARWVHVGCEVSSNFIRLHIDGKVVGEKLLGSILDKSPDLKSFSGLILAATDGESEGLHGYIHNTQILPIPLSIKDQCIKDPPLRLSVDYQSAYEIEEEIDGVWGIVSGKASCRRKFALDVLLLDVFGRPANKEWEVLASLVYNDDRSLVEKSEDGEDALLASFDGLEFPSVSRPSKLIQGRASFKLKISQLSSKCNNRLFSIKFSVGSYPFLETFTPAIRCISRSRNSKVLGSTWKKLSSGVHVVNGSSLPAHPDARPELHHNAVCEARASPPSKRVKLGRDTLLLTTNSDPSSQRPHEELNSHALEANKVRVTHETCIREKATGNSSSDTESDDARNFAFRDKACSRESFSDVGVFKYCLGGLSERSTMLKEIVPYSPDEEIVRFAGQVSLYTGCYHHRQQILIAKRLLGEGEKTWNLISQNRHRLQWQDVVFDIEEQFMRIACCSTRPLTQQDFNFLRRISGCHDYMTRENFDKMWKWLYPIAVTISKAEINGLWASTSPKWIEGFSTKEEVEYALQNPMGIQQPGTFVLRFPTSRSWPHPDAGCLVVTFVGRDYNLKHRLLSLDYSSRRVAANAASLQELLLAEPELCRLRK